MNATDLLILARRARQREEERIAMNQTGLLAWARDAQAELHLEADRRDIQARKLREKPMAGFSERLSFLAADNANDRAKHLRQLAAALDVIAETPAADKEVAEIDKLKQVMAI